MRRSEPARRLAALVLATALAACAGAPDPSAERTRLGPPPSSFAKLDADGNDSVSRAEWDAHGQRVFDAADANQDGVIDEAEWDTVHATLDLDGDGALTSHEIDTAGIDTDGDGRVSAAEWAEFNVTERFDEDRDGRTSRAEFERRRAARFDAMDVDLNARVSGLELDRNQRWTAFTF